MKRITLITVFLLTASMFLCSCGNDVIPTATGSPTIAGIATSSAAKTDESRTSETGSSEATTSSSESTHQSTTRPDLKDVDLSKVIALTFDDGPATNTPSSTERILNVLEKYGCKATFFVQGINMTYSEFKERNRAIVKREADLGMQIGSHSYDHPNFNKCSDEEIHNQINKSIELIKEATGGYDVHIVRTPGGAEKQNVKDAINMPILSWSIDTLDWDTKDADNTYNVIMNNIKGGAIVLMHDTYKATADAVERVVPDLVAKGYVLVTIDELFELYGQKLEPHTVYYKAKLSK